MYSDYDFEIGTTEELMRTLAINLQKRRLEKGLSRITLAEKSKVPAGSIAKFEQKYIISLAYYVSLAKALGYANSIKTLLSEPIYTTADELDTINRNQQRQRGDRNGTTK